MWLPLYFYWPALIQIFNVLPVLRVTHSEQPPSYPTDCSGQESVLVMHAGDLYWAQWLSQSSVRQQGRMPQQWGISLTQWPLEHLSSLLLFLMCSSRKRMKHQWDLTQMQSDGQDSCLFVCSVCPSQYYHSGVRSLGPLLKSYYIRTLGA